MSLSKTEQIFDYRINKFDEITEVSNNWNDFALRNAASPSCLHPEVINRPIWDFIADKETINLYMMLVDKVRHTDAAIDIPIRCDSPDLIRFLTISIKSLPESQVEFSSKILSEVPRDPILLLDNNADRSDETLTICSYCKKVEVTENSWNDVEKAITLLNLFNCSILPRLSHGVCPACYEIVLKELK